MRKRAGLARALVLEPKILLADEPSSGLDRITASEIDELLLRQKAEHKTALIVVTHDVRGARRLADRIAVLDKGILLAAGTFAEIEHSESEIARHPLVRAVLDAFPGARIEAVRDIGRDTAVSPDPETLADEPGEGEP